MDCRHCTYLVAYLVTYAYLVTSSTALPLKEAMTTSSDRNNVNTISETKKDNSKGLLKDLLQRKNVLEDILRETDSQISKITETKAKPGHSAHQSEGLDLPTRFTDHGPSMEKPTKRVLTRVLDSTSESKTTTASRYIDKLKAVLIKLENKEKARASEKATERITERTTERTTAPATTPKAKSSISKLYKELNKLDIDLNRLLGAHPTSESTHAASESADKRSPPRGGSYRGGRYPKVYSDKRSPRGGSYHLGRYPKQHSVK